MRSSNVKKDKEVGLAQMCDKTTDVRRVLTLQLSQQSGELPDLLAIMKGGGSLNSKCSLEK